MNLLRYHQAPHRRRRPPQGDLHAGFYRAQDRRGVWHVLQIRYDCWWKPGVPILLHCAPAAPDRWAFAFAFMRFRRPTPFRRHERTSWIGCYREAAEQLAVDPEAAGEAYERFFGRCYRCNDAPTLKTECLRCQEREHDDQGLCLDSQVG